MEIDESNGGDLLDKDKLTNDKSNESLTEIDSNGHTEEVNKIESTPPIPSEPCTSSESAKSNLTNDNNDSLANNSNKVTSQPSELNIILNTAAATSYNSDTGKDFIAKLREKYSADFQIETYYILKVKCPSEHSKIVDRQIKKFINLNSSKNKELKEIKNDFEMLPSIFKLTEPHDLWTRLKRLNRKLKKTTPQNIRDKICRQERISTLEKQLSAFLIGKEKMRGEGRTVHFLDVLDKFFKCEDNKNLNKEVIKAHNFIFLSTFKSLRKMVQRWDEQHKNVKITTEIDADAKDAMETKEIDNKDAPTETTETTTNEEFDRYADQLLTVCRNGRLRGQLAFVKKKIRLNKFDDDIKKLLFRIGRTVKVPFTIDNNEKLSNLKISLPVN